MTRVRLRVPYLSRAARGVPGQVLELEDAAARRLVSAGRATLADAPPATDVDGQADGQEDSEPKRTKRAGGATPVRSGRGRRAKPPAEDPFYNPDVQPAVFDPLGGRSIRHD
ncbi:hypothetical protein QNO09_32990 [Streptomyces sp. 378]|uniref:hypothetical protein n=1 Tax=Streptomyces sp. 378 TaxID=3049412 RepID=UPI0024C42C6D|nr:hypothetical protein [Streptomyces sp. 378]MDK1348015.1 hypothetical protein [Streptomyces sp. 378]